MMKDWIPRTVCPLLYASSAMLVAGVAQAEIINVSPGYGTLPDAVEAAAPGDTLLLTDGSYEWDASNFVIDKSLTIRALDASTNPTVVFPTVHPYDVAFIYVDEYGTNVTFQGIHFTAAGTRSRVQTRGADSIQVLECTSSNVDWEIGAGTVTDPALGSVSRATVDAYFIGNSFSGGNWTSWGSTLLLSVSRQLVFAGNTVEWRTALPTWSVEDDGRGHILGNHIVAGSASTNLSLSGRFDVIGNTLQPFIGGGTTTSVGGWYPTILTVTGPTQIRNNLFNLPLPREPGVSGLPISYTAIDVQSAEQQVRIHNNVIDFGGLAYGPDGTRAAIELGTAAIVSGNVIVGGDLAAIHGANEDILQQAEISYNLCFDNGVDCGTADGNLEDDPLLDNADYRLGEGSPAVNAGPPALRFSDHDLSRNDLGIHGGPHPIDQFGVQLALPRVEPFLYPLFNATDDLTADNTLPIEILTVARLR